MTIDRENRNALAAAVNRFLSGESSAFQFDEEIFAIRSDDRTIPQVVASVWLFYDDLKDHKVRLSKEAWDYFQRLLLVLDSDGQIEVIERRRWTFSQLVAVASLLVAAYAASQLGLGRQLLALVILLGLVSIAISQWRRRTSRRMDPTMSTLVPFSSITEMIRVRRSVPRFKKRKYPPGMKPFKIRTPLEEMAIKLKSYAAWLFFSPVALAFQSLPSTETKTRVVMDEELPAEAR